MSTYHEELHEHGVHEEKGERHMFTVDEVRENLLLPNAVQWIPFKDLLLDVPESCVDGRGEYGVVGVPGGNAGELLLAITAAEADEVSGGKKFDLSNMNSVLRRSMRKLGRTYMHTDEHSLNTIRVEGEPITEAMLRNPAGKIREKLLEELVKPEHIGCGHLRLMLAKSDVYGGVRPEVVRAFIEQFYRELWRGNKNADLEVLRGKHTEGAVLSIEVEGPVDMDTMIPTVRPEIRGKQAFVHHPQMADHLRKECAEWIGEVTKLLIRTPEERAGYLEQVNALGGMQLMATLEALAKGLPLMRVTFHPDRSFTVSKVMDI